MEKASSIKIPRGIRNNNPLNIRLGEHWYGLCEVQSDPDFCQFKSMTFGIRASFRLLRTYIVLRKWNTIERIISHWAPANENSTEAYIRFVVEKTGIPANREISYYHREVMFSLFDAMCLMETGHKIQRYIVANAYALV